MAGRTVLRLDSGGHRCVLQSHRQSGSSTEYLTLSWDRGVRKQRVHSWHSDRGVTGEQADLPAEQSAPGEDPRLQAAHAHPRGACHHLRAQAQGPRGTVRLSRRQTIGGVAPGTSHAPQSGLRSSGAHGTPGRQRHDRCSPRRTRRGRRGTDPDRLHRLPGGRVRRRPQSCQAQAAGGAPRETRPDPPGTVAGRTCTTRRGRRNRRAAAQGPGLRVEPDPGRTGRTPSGSRCVPGRTKGRTMSRGTLVGPWRGLRRIPSRVLIAVFRLWQLLVSPTYGQTCRFYPTCSSYGVGAVREHGALRGGWLTVRRILRCHPWNPGGVDLVPPKDPGHAHCRTFPRGERSVGSDRHVTAEEPILR